MKSQIIARLRGTAAAIDIEAAARAAYPPDLTALLFPRPLIPAAVLVALIERQQGLTVLLTRRTEHLRDHAGQISFPGGRLEPADTGLLAAALREAREELGIDAAVVEIAGHLPPHAVVTGFAVAPIVGFLPATIRLRPDPLEVAEAFEVPLDFLCDPRNLLAARRQIGALELPVWEYQFESHRIWGATAHILKTFVDIIV